MIEVNLLPKELQIQGPRLTFSKGMIIPAAAVVAVILGMTGMSVIQNGKIAELDGKIQIAQARADQLKADIRMVDGLVNIKEKITARIDAVKVLDLNRKAWVSILEDLSTRVPDFLWMTSLSETVAPKAPKKAPGDTAAPARLLPPQEVPAQMRGFAYSLSGLANFIMNLRKSGHFKSVDLHHAREMKLESHTAYAFQLDCTLSYSGGLSIGDGMGIDAGANIAKAPESMGK